MDKMKKVCCASVLVIMAFGGWVTAEGSEPIPGMISYWNLDEGEGDMAYDSFGNNDGSLNDPCWATGQIGGALEFNGVDDYVDLGPDSSLKPDFPITFSAWIKRSSTGGIDVMVFLGCGHSSWYHGSWFAISFDKLVVGFGDGTGSSTSDRRTKTGTSTIGVDTVLYNRPNLNHVFKITWKIYPPGYSKEELSMRIKKMRALVDREKPIHTDYFFEIIPVVPLPF